MGYREREGMRVEEVGGRREEERAIGAQEGKGGVIIERE